MIVETAKTNLTISKHASIKICSVRVPLESQIRIRNEYSRVADSDPDPYPDSIGSVDQDQDLDQDQDPDPDPGGQKLPTKVKKIKKFHILKCWMASFES